MKGIVHIFTCLSLWNRIGSTKIVCTAIHVDYYQLIGHCLLGFIAQACRSLPRRCYKSRRYGSLVGRVFIVKEYTIQIVCLTSSLEFLCKLLCCCRAKVSHTGSIMVTQYTQDDFHSLILQWFQVFLFVFQDMCDIGVVRYDNFSSL